MDDATAAGAYTMGELQKLFHEMEERAAYSGFTFKEILMSRNPVVDPTNPTKVLGLTWDIAVDWLQMGIKVNFSRKQKGTETDPEIQIDR